MQVFGLQSNIYKLYNYARPQEIKEKYRKIYEPIVKKWEELKSQGVSEDIIPKYSGCSRAKYYRCKKVLNNLHKNIYPPSKRPKKFRKSNISESVKQRILQIRRDNPTYGKAKITVILLRDFDIKLSESSVGRVLKDLMNRGIIQKSISSLKKKRRRKFDKHAKKWSYGMKARKPGQLIQIDHMSVYKNGVACKHFQAWDPVTKTIVAQVYNKATSLNAKNFLNMVIEQMPFKIESIQVDGGSEFMLHFEQYCNDLNIELFVLPPSRPQYNGGVERANRIFREEFYDNKNFFLESFGQIKNLLREAVYKYNNYRPHFCLKGMTPYMYNKFIMEDSS